MSSEKPFSPKFFELLSGYNPAALVRDLKAGLVVAAFALPLCLAFGVATGLGPGAGLLTSVVAGLVAALFGGSRVQVTGPTAIFIVVISGILAVHGIVGLVIATLLAGILLVIFGSLKLGSVLRILPQPVLVGFTAAIALTLIVAQCRDFFGFEVPWLALDLFSRVGLVWSLFGTINYWAFGLGVATIIGVMVGERFLPKVPWTLVAVVFGAAAVAVLGLKIPTLGENFGNLQPELRFFDFGGLSYHSVIQLLPSAFTLAFLGAVESLLSASVADGLVSDRHRPNTELIGQGFANTASALLGGLPATGASGRTTVNVRSGGRTPVAALVHSLVLLAVWAGLGFLAWSVPLAVLAGLVISVAIEMVDFKEFRLILKTTPADALALVTTFAVTLAVDLAFALISGLLVALLFFVRGLAQTSHTIERAQPQTSDLPAGTHVLDLNGAFFFGAASKFDEAIRPLLTRARTVILRMGDVNLLDATGTRVLHRILADAKVHRVRVVLSEVQPPVLQVMEHSELIQAIGPANLFASFEGALRDVKINQPLVFGTADEDGCQDPL